MAVARDNCLSTIGTNITNAAVKITPKSGNNLSGNQPAMLPANNDPVAANTITAKTTNEKGRRRLLSVTMGRIPSKGVILPAKYAGTKTPISDIAGPKMAAMTNGPGVIISDGTELEYTFIMPAVKRHAPPTPALQPSAVPVTPI